MNEGKHPGDWLIRPSNLSRKRQIGFKRLRSSSLKTARTIKETAIKQWCNARRVRACKCWQTWAVRHCLEHLEKVAATLMNHRWGIIPMVPPPKGATAESERAA